MRLLLRTTLHRDRKQDDSRDDQAEGGWSGRAKLSGGQESQTKGQGTVRLLLKRAAAEAARRGANGPNKGLLMTCLLKKRRAEKQLFA